MRTPKVLYVQGRAQEIGFYGSRDQSILAKDSRMMAGDEHKSRMRRRMRRQMTVVVRQKFGMRGGAAFP